MKKILSIFLSIILASFVIAGTVPAAFAADEYTVTFSAGDKGSFTDALYQSYAGTYGSGNVTRTAIGNIKITVPSNSPVPNPPTAADVDLGSYANKYYVTSGWGPTEPTVTKNATYVVSYGAIVDGVEYTVRYVDAATGNDVASPVIATGNIGDKMTFTAKNIGSYDYDAFEKEITLSGDAAANVLTFSYTLQGGAATPTPAAGTVTVVTGTGTADGGDTAGTGANDGGTAAGADGAESGTDGNTEAIENNTPPLAGADETIGDENVPASNWLENGNGATWAIVGGIAGALIIAAIILMIVKKKARHA